MGELAIQKRSLRGFSSESTSTFDIFPALAPDGRSVCGVSAMTAAGTPISAD
jgi:hypothetical protein